MDYFSSLRLNSRNIIPTDEIIFLKSDINYTDVHTLDNRKHTSSFTLKVLEKRITDTNLIRINKGLIINRLYIKEINSESKEAFVKMISGQLLPISRRKYKLISGSLTYWLVVDYIFIEPFFKLITWKK